MAKTLYRDKFLTVTVSDINVRGKKIAWHTYKEIDAAIVLPVMDDGRIVLENQYRHGIRKHMIEVPAGLIEKGEKPIEAAKRELEEETGYVAGKIRPMFKEFYNPAFSNRTFYYFLATDLSRGKVRLDESEIIKPILMAPEQVEKMIRAGRLHDHKTMVSFLYYKNYLMGK